jgi:hypothetical protein
LGHVVETHEVPMEVEEHLENQRGVHLESSEPRKQIGY